MNRTATRRPTYAAPALPPPPKGRPGIPGGTSAAARMAPAKVPGFPWRRRAETAGLTDLHSRSPSPRWPDRLIAATTSASPGRLAHATFPMHGRGAGSGPIRRASPGSFLSGWTRENRENAVIEGGREPAGQQKELSLDNQGQPPAAAVRYRQGPPERFHRDRKRQQSSRS